MIPSASPTRGADIRPATPADAAACAAIMAEWVAETDWFPSDRPQGASAARMQDQIARGPVWLAIGAGRVAGFAALDGDTLAALYVSRHWRGRGLGSLLLAQAQTANPAGLWLWTFQANTAARRFYERAGCMEMSRSDGGGNDEGLPDICYRWPGMRA